MAAGADGAELVPLARIIATLDGPGAERQLEGVLGVLRQQLQQAPSLSDRVVMELFCGLEALLSRGSAAAPASGSGGSGGGAAASLAEEVCVAGWDALRALLSCYTGGQLREPRLRLRLGHVISLALDTATASGAGLELRACGVAAVAELWRAVDDADCLSCFFPGVASALCRAVAGCADARQNHALTCSALQTFAQVCEAILGDTACAAAGLAHEVEPSPLAVVEGWRQQQQHKQQKQQQNGSGQASTAAAGAPTGAAGPGVGVDEDGRTYHYPHVIRDRTWLTETSVRVCRLLNSALQHTARSENWRVRASAVHMAEQLLRTCTGAVAASSRQAPSGTTQGSPDVATDGAASEDSLGALLCDTIVGSLYSDSPLLTKTARAALVSVRGIRCYTSGGAGGLLRDARQRLHSLCTEVRRAMRQADDSRKHATLLLLCGYLEGSMGDSAAGQEPQPAPLSPTLVRRVLGVLLAAVVLQPSSIGAVEKNLHSYRAIATAAQQEHAAQLSGVTGTTDEREESERADDDTGVADSSCADSNRRGTMGMGRLSGASGSAQWRRRYLHFDDDGVESALRCSTKLLYLAAPTGMVLDLVTSASRGEDIAADGMGEAIGGNALNQSLLLKRQAAALVMLDYLLTPETRRRWVRCQPQCTTAAASAAAATAVMPDEVTGPVQEGASSKVGDEEQGVALADKSIAAELAPICSWVLQDMLAAIDNGCAVASASMSGDEWLALAPLGVAVGSLGVDCLGKLAVGVGGDAFAPLLMHCLYPLLERVSDESAEVSDAALRALVAVAQTMHRHTAAGDRDSTQGSDNTQHYGTLAVTPDEEVRWLLMANMDYIVDVICARLRYLHEHPSTPQVLQAVLAFTGVAVLPYIHDTLETLFECVEISEERYLINFFTILRAVMESLLLDQSLQPLSTLTKSPVPAADCTQDVGGGVSQADEDQGGARITKTQLDTEVALLEGYIDAHFKWISPDEPSVLEESTEPEPTAESPTPESSPVLTAVMATRILECCQHFVAGNGLRLKLIVFEVMASCIRFLGTQISIEKHSLANAAQGCAKLSRPQYQHRSLIMSDFLPTVATLWEPFCRRLSEQSDSDAPALVAAMQVMTQMASCCGDFIARRFHDEAWPQIARYLSRYLAHRAAAATASGASSASACASARHGFTRQHKVIEAALGLMITLSTREEIFAANKTQRVSAVALCCVGFLSSREPPEYQVPAMTLFRNLIAIEADAVWILLAGLATPDTAHKIGDRYGHANGGGCAATSTANVHAAPADEARGSHPSSDWLQERAQPTRATSEAPSAGVLFRSFTGADSRDICRVRKGSPSGRPRVEFQANCTELLRRMA
eukprot:COSAG06_NODE_147_length_22091_cov_70.669880_5_plen_1348_part_00